VSAFALAVAGLVGVTAMTATPAHAETAVDLAYVVDMSASAVRVVDPANQTIIGSIAVPASPEQLVASPDKQTAYVTSYGGADHDHLVSVIDLAARTITHTIQVCNGPALERLKPDGSQLWVACYSGGITVVDTATDTVTATIRADLHLGLGGVVFSPDGATAYTTADDGPGAGVHVIDTATDAITATISAGPYSGFGMALSPDGSKLYLAVQGKDEVAVVDTASKAITSTFPLAGVSDAGTLNPAGTTLYYCLDFSRIVVVDAASGTVTRTLTIPCGGIMASGFGSMAFTPDGTTLYDNAGYHGLNVIDVATGAVTATIPNGPQLVEPVDIEFVRAASAPTVTAISPAQGPDIGGGQVVITGGPFLGASGATAVSFGGVPAAAFTVDSDTQITATAPPGAPAATVDVAVGNDNGMSATGPADRYTCLPTTTISALTPSSGVSSGGTSVVITGTDLSTATSVYFGGTAASSFTIDSDTQITAVTRAQHNGTVNVSVTNANGTSAAVPASQFTFFSPVPIVSSISPASGSTAGGTAVTITGLRFGGTFRVDFGGVAVPYTLDSDSQITVITPAWASDMAPAAGAASPAGPGGPVDVTVTTDVETSALSSADVYTYVPPVPPTSPVSDH
jgi:DNA-binding beta-propeller fold protein YncE